LPELPEVETVVRDLRPHLTGCRIASVEVGKKKLRRPWSSAWNTLLVGQTIREVRRRGKWIVMALESPHTLLAHLGMTGQLTVAPATEPRLNHTHVVIALDGTFHELRFRDTRRFGSMTLFPDDASLNQFFEAAKLGPEPFDLDAKSWPPRLAGTKRNLKAVLLDQRVVSGVGNIYADEALWLARLHPGRIARTLARTEANRLRRAIVDVLTRAIERRGSTIRDYIGGSGLKGGYQEEFRVYGRTGEPCRRCRTAIVETRLAGRSSHYCPKCQGE
jgi:formamidopyrimidine-DNA glycosylase